MGIDAESTDLTERIRARKRAMERDELLKRALALDPNFDPNTHELIHHPDGAYVRKRRVPLTAPRNTGGQRLTRGG